MEDVIDFVFGILEDTEQNVGDYQSWVHDPEQWEELRDRFVQLITEAGYDGQQMLEEYRKAWEEENY